MRICMKICLFLEGFFELRLYLIIWFEEGAEIIKWFKIVYLNIDARALHALLVYHFIQNLTVATP